MNNANEIVSQINQQRQLENANDLTAKLNASSIADNMTNDIFATAFNSIPEADKTKRKSKKKNPEQKQELEKLEMELKALEKQTRKVIIKETKKKAKEPKTALQQTIPVVVPKPQVDLNALQTIQNAIRVKIAKTKVSNEIEKIVKDSSAQKIQKFIKAKQISTSINDRIEKKKIKSVIDDEKKKRAAKKRQEMLEKLKEEEEQIKALYNVDINDIYKKMSNLKKVSERKPVLFNEDNELEKIIYEEKIKEYSSKILQAKLRRNVKLIAIAKKQAELEEQRKQDEWKSISDNFNTIWIDPEILAAKALEEAAANANVKPKKKILTIPKPND